MSDKNTQRKLAQLGAWCLECHRENECSDIDGADIEKMAIEYGLMQWVEVEKPCGEDGACWCLSYHGDGGFPVDCLRMREGVRADMCRLLTKEG